jgi:hypothetical protein
VKFRFPCIALAFCLTAVSLRADWKDEIGFTRLQSLAGGELPTVPAQGLTQVEAPELGKYIPDEAHPLFSSKTLTPKSGPSAVSTHAQHVAENFYGSASLLPGTCEVDLYNVINWVGSGFLNYGGGSPNPEIRAVQNHSWAGSLGSTPVNTEISRRLDFAIDRDGFVCAVGLYNEDINTPIHPQLLCQTYNTISVGRDDGGHTKGLTTLDGAGRMKPDIVAPSAAPEYATSWTTPMVAGAAGLLHATLTADVPSLVVADRPRVIKALLMASATKDTVPNWDNTSTAPLDSIYGSGELNVWNACSTLLSGHRSASGSTSVPERGWAAETATGTAKTYYFTIPTGAPATPFCAALTWHRTVTAGAWSSSLADLNLRLHHASGFSAIEPPVASSVGSIDNVELVYQSALPPGNYALVVSNSSGSDTPYALAWHSLPAVTVVSNSPTAREIDGLQGSITFTRTGDTTLPLFVPISVGGSATPGTHYSAPPASVTIPAGQTSATLPITPVSDSLAQGDRTVSVSVAADFALVRDPSQAGVVTIEDKPYDDWRFTNFTPLELANPALSGETADPDADQLDNLVEYALGLNPKVPNASPVTPLDAGGFLALSATKNQAATDLLWDAEVSGDLNIWSPADTTETTSTFEAQDTVLMNQAESRFIRLKIIRP